MVPQFLRLSNRAIEFFETNFYPAGSTIFDGPDLEFDKCAVIVAGLAKALQGACATAGGAGRNATGFSMELAVYSATSLLVMLGSSGRLGPLLEQGAFSAWTPATLVPLSHDDTSGALTGIVSLPAGWHRGAGAIAGDVEFFVLSGALRIGTELRGWGYYEFAPAGARQPDWVVEEQCSLLCMARGSPEFAIAGTASATGRIELDTETLPWTETLIGGAISLAAVLWLTFRMARDGKPALSARGRGLHVASVLGFRRYRSSSEPKV